MKTSKEVRAVRPESEVGFGAQFAAKFPSATRLALVLIWPLSLVLLYASVRHLINGNTVGQDSHAYWLAAQGELSYGAAPGQRDAYLYSPVFITAIKPLALLPWPVFGAAWFGIQAVILAWLVKPLRARWAIPVVFLCTPELVVGNIYLLLAATAAVGIKWPAVWSFAVLTKVTTGVGLLWFAARRDWKRLLQGIGATGIIVAVSFAFDPAAWTAWVQFLLDHRDGTPDSRVSFILRCLAAVMFVLVGAYKQWPILIAPAMVLASPVLTPIIPWTILAALPRLLMAPTGRSMTSQTG